MSKTKKPSGLSIERSGSTYTVKWKIGDKDYGGGQQLNYSINGGAWTPSTIGNTATSFSISNNTVKTIAFRIRGNRKKYRSNGKEINPGWSDWASLTWTATKPVISELKYENTGSNQGVFSWVVNSKTDDTAILTSVKSYSVIMRSDAAPKSWGSGTSTNATGSTTITENTTDMEQGNFVRWFRIEATGPAGSVTKDIYHAYGAPVPPQLLNAYAETVGSSVTRLTAIWTDKISTLNAVDTIQVEYVIDSPTDASMQAPVSGWGEAAEFLPTSSSDKIIVNIDDAIGVDECLWVRIKSLHDGLASYSNEWLAQVGVLETPTIDAVANATTGDVSITITRESEVSEACTAIFFRSEDDPSNDRIVAIFNKTTTSGTVNVPEIIGASTTCFGAYAFLGSYDGSSLIVEPVMVSAKVIDSDIAAVAPASVSVVQGSREGTVRIGWAWSWNDAQTAELSWADHEDAWEATDEPNSYTVTDRHATSWVIAGLETANRWFFRVRLIAIVDDNEVIGPWSDTVIYNSYGTPDRPVLTLSKDVVNAGDSVTARWAFSSVDGAEQAYAEVCLVTYEEDDNDNIVPVYGDVIAHTDINQRVELIYAWATDTTYYLAVRITTAAGTQSAWSDPAALYIAEPVSAEISFLSMTVPGMYYYRTYTYMDMGQGYNWYKTAESTTCTGTITYRSRNVDTSPSNPYVEIRSQTENTRTTYEEWRTEPDAPAYLASLPLSVTVLGAGDTGTTIMAIVREEDYHLYRPDDKDYDGYKGETVASFTQQGEATITIDKSDLVGYLDDGAKYIIRGTVIDEYGQTASIEVPFTVDWVHKAGVPNVEVIVDKYLRAAKITPIAPSGYAAGDTCDIYRLTADQPELVYKGAAFGETYVDPYPGFGDLCGHRLVTVTKNGDYVSASGFAWYDADVDDGDLLVDKKMVIDVDGDQIELPYNIELSNAWNKDFERTEYLGGSVQGDWNPAVTRDLTARTVLLRGRDIDKQLSMRDLAGYAGIAHIRTPDGSSLACDIQVRENMDYKSKRVSYSLTIRAIDPQEPEGVTLDEWQAMHPIGG